MNFKRGNQSEMIDYSTSGNIVLLRLNDPPLNVLTFEMLNALSAAVDRANDDPEVGGIVITGTSDYFSAGADVNLFKTVFSEAHAATISRRFQETFDHVEQSEKPVCAAIAGSVTGGALELALAGHYRVCAATTRCSMPEVNLGILPGAGGTQRLPRLIGPDAALDMLLSARPVDAKEALIIGLVDALCEPSELIAAAQKLVTRGKKPPAGSGRTDKIADAAANAAAFEKARRKAAETRPEIIAPYKIIEAVTTGITGSYAEGLVKEQTGFAQCMATPAARNKIHLFFATRATGKVYGLPSAEPAAIATTAVIGMGSMGTGIAQVFAVSGKKTLVLDSDDKTAEKGVARIAESLERKVQRGSTTRQKADTVLGRISVAKNWDELASADLIIEAVFENIEIKQALMEKIGAVCTSQTIVASNTSTIDLDCLAEKLPRPQRLVGLHFFNPAHSMPLVEVIRCDTTDPAVVASAMRFMKDLRKTPVLVNNSVGFVVNRLFIPYLIEAFQLLEEGAQPEEIDAAMVAFGFSMGPLTLIDMAGIDILFFTDRMMHAAYPSHIPLSRIATSMVDEGLLGQKAGCGVYLYEKGDRTPKKSGRTETIIARVRGEPGGELRTFTREEITDRLVFRMVAEGFHVVEEEIARRETDIDVAMVLGAGFPDFRGGVINYARDLGLQEVVARLSALAAACGERYQPCYYLLSKQ
ncbi:MAG: enoyl-CoA hydratase/isomerase family protein [Chitinispirillaceae bacterium]|nr:enoyl-CoA hydratase/isomerase family protein [Chitinispirillaceae bacterium]